MIRYLILCAFLLCRFSYAGQQYDHVVSVTVGGEEITKPIVHGQWRKALDVRRQPRIKTSVLSECTGNRDVILSGLNPVVRLEFYPEDNETADLHKIFGARSPNVTDDSLRARIWIEWPSVETIRQEVRVGAMLVSAGLRVETFAAQFPLSYRKGVDDGSSTKAAVFEVLFGVVRSEGGENEFEEAPPYTPSVQFYFEDGRLKRLKILQGVAC